MAIICSRILQNHFRAFEIHPHLLNEKVGNANAVNLIARIELAPSLHHRPNHALSLELLDKIPCQPYKF